MGTYTVDGTGRPGILHLKLVGRMAEEEMRAFVAAHNAAIDDFAGADYRVFCDVSEMAPLSPECAALFEQAKAYSNAHENFQGSSVLVKSSVVALQHERTSVAGGVMSTELISTDEEALWRHLATVSRRRP